MPAAGPPKGISKLLTVTNSGHMRSPPLVERFRRAKENVLRAVTAPPPDLDVNNKLMTLEAMFHQVRRLRSCRCDAMVFQVCLPCVDCKDRYVAGRLACSSADRLAVLLDCLLHPVGTKSCMPPGDQCLLCRLMLFPTFRPACAAD